MCLQVRQKSGRRSRLEISSSDGLVASLIQPTKDISI